MTRAPPERFERVLSIAALTLVIELILFKFLPDLSTALLQHDTSSLADFAAFRRQYIVPGSVHHARFLGNYILYGLARLLAAHTHSGDIRLHPLRLAAAVLTPLYAVAGCWPALRERSGYEWREFIVPYGLAVSVGLYVFYPADMPALAALSVALYLLLRERLAAALAVTLLLGLFRESAFHMVLLVGLWALGSRSHRPAVRAAWTAAFAFAFAAEYVLVRHFFPGPLTSTGGILLDPRQIFFGRGLLSLTSFCSLGLAALYPIACAHRLRGAGSADWRVGFFRLNCWAFPAWVVFYRMMNGNITEFRLLLPALLPCMYGLAFPDRLTPE